MRTDSVHKPFPISGLIYVMAYAVAVVDVPFHWSDADATTAPPAIENVTPRNNFRTRFSIPGTLSFRTSSPGRSRRIDRYLEVYLMSHSILVNAAEIVG